MGTIRSIHSAETTNYVRDLVQELHRSEEARVLIYSRQPYAVALKTIATERAAALELLRDAIDEGLLDELAARKSGKDVAAMLNADPVTEAFVDAADAERYAQREEFVNGPGFAVNDLVNVSDPNHKHFGTRGSIVGFVYDPDGVVVEYDNLGNTTTVPASLLMHHADFIAAEAEQPTDDGGALNDHGRDYAEEAAQRAEAEREGVAELLEEQLAARDAESEA